MFIVENNLRCGPDMAIRYCGNIDSFFDNICLVYFQYKASKGKEQINLVWLCDASLVGKRLVLSAAAASPLYCQVIACTVSNICLVYCQVL